MHAYTVLIFFELGVLWVSPLLGGRRNLSRSGPLPPLRMYTLRYFTIYTALQIPFALPAFSRIFSWCPWTPCHQDRHNQFLSAFEICRASASLSTNAVFLFCRNCFYTFDKTFGHMYSGLDVARMFVDLHLDHVYLV